MQDEGRTQWKTRPTPEDVVLNSWQEIFWGLLPFPKFAFVGGVSLSVIECNIAGAWPSWREPVPWLTVSQMQLFLSLCAPQFRYTCKVPHAYPS